MIPTTNVHLTSHDKTIIAMLSKQRSDLPATLPGDCSISTVDILLALQKALAIGHIHRATLKQMMTLYYHIIGKEKVNFSSSNSKDTQSKELQEQTSEYLQQGGDVLVCSYRDPHKKKAKKRRSTHNKYQRQLDKALEALSKGKSIEEAKQLLEN